MKIVLCTTPIRPVPTDYPPFGSLALVQYLRQFGYDPYFYDIDGLRPRFDEVISFFLQYQPDLIAISSVVSTAYAYTQKLCLELKRQFPHVPLILGGNLAASAELMHRFAKVDVCVVGEGEKPLLHLVRQSETDGGRLFPAALHQIPGITFLDEEGEMVFTDYDLPIPPEQFLDPDFGILERYSKIENFITDPLQRPDFARDPRTYEPHRRGQKMSTVLATKGCVARCTFCHRWDKGFRHLSAEAVVRRMRYLKDRYNVGFFQFGDENFGSDRYKLEELIALIKPLDVLYEVSGVRCRSVDLPLLRRLKESGCVALYYGMETGSPRILKVMEKNASLEHNLQAAAWTEEAGLYTIYQLVLGMPGENRETIQETIDFVKRVTENREDPPHKLVSANYIQALPGTAVYEYARQSGMLGKTLEDESKYLTKISDINANDDTKFLNFTDSDYFTVQTWRTRILFEAEAHWYRLRGWRPYVARSPLGVPIDEKDYYTEGGYFNMRQMMGHPWVFRFGWPFRSLYFLLRAVLKDFLRLPPRTFWCILSSSVRTRWRPTKKWSDFRSLRRIVDEQTPAESATPSGNSMRPLRRGR